VNQYGGIEEILSHASEITKKRSARGTARAGRRGPSVQVAGHDQDGYGVPLDLEAARVQEPDFRALRCATR